MTARPDVYRACSQAAKDLDSQRLADDERVICGCRRFLPIDDATFLSRHSADEAISRRHAAGIREQSSQAAIARHRHDARPHSPVDAEIRA